MSEAIGKVLGNVSQSFTDNEKRTARTNIGAIGGVKVTDSTGTTELVPDDDGKVTINMTGVDSKSSVTLTSDGVASPVSVLDIDSSSLSVSADETAVGYLAPESLATGSGDVGKVLTCYKDYVDNTHYGWMGISKDAQLMLGYSSGFNTFSSTATVGNNWTRMTLEANPIKFNPISQSLDVLGFYYFDINVQMLGCCPGGPGNGKSVALGFEVEGINCTVSVAYPNYSSTVTYGDHLLYVYNSAMDLSGDIDSHFKGVFQITGTVTGNHSVYVHVWFRTTSELDNVFTLPASADAVMHACPPWYTYTNRLADNSIGRAAGSMFRM